MSFPLSPANNQVTLENGISYTYNTSRGAWYRTPATALASITANTITALNNLIVGGNTSVTGSILPSATLTYDLGSADLRWRDLYLSGNTLNLGTASITTDANTGAIALIPAVTEDNPDPIGLIIGANGSTTTIQTVRGRVTAANIRSSILNTNSTVSDFSLTYYAANTANLAVAVNTTQNTNIIIATNAATAAYTQANTTATNLTNFTELFTGVEVTQNARLIFTESYTQAAFDKANSANILAQAAFAAANAASGGGDVIDSYARTTANSKFDSTGGTISGSVTVSNDLTVNGNVSFIGNVTSINLAGNVLALTASTASNTSVGYLGVPQRVVPMGGSDQLVLSDAGKQLYLIPTSNVYSIFIPSNATVPFPVGTAIVTVLTGPYTSNVAPLAGVTLRMAGNTSGANIARTLGSYSMASLLKVENDVWFISGAGVT